MPKNKPEAGQIGRAQAIKQMNEAGKAYAQFKKREEQNRIFTREQRRQRRRSFLEAHIGVLDAYEPYLGKNRLMVGLTSEARDLAQDIAGNYDLLVGRAGKGAVRPGNGKRGEIDIQGKAYENYKNRLDQNAINSETRYEGGQAAEIAGDAQKPSKQQIKGIRDIFAWMYRTSKTHQSFVDGLAAKPPRQKLIMCWIVETDKRHNLSMADMNGLTEYIPSLEEFKKKVKFTKHWYKFGAKDINWDLISDAAQMAFRLEALPLENENVEQAEEQEKKDTIPSGMREKEEDPVKEALEEEESEKSGMKEEESDKSEEDSVDENKAKVKIADSQILLRYSSKLEGIEHLSKEISMDMASEGESKKDDAKSKLAKLNDNIKGLEEELGPEAEKELYKELFEELTSSPAGAGTNIRALNTELQKRTKYLGTLRQFVSTAQNVLKGYSADKLAADKEAAKKAAEQATSEAIQGLLAGTDQSAGETSEGGSKSEEKQLGKFKYSDLLNNISTWASFGFDSPMTLLNVVNMLAQVSGLIKSYKSSSWGEIFSKSTGILAAAGNTGKTGISAATSGAKLFSDVGWASSQILKSTGSYLGIGVGTLNAGIGIFNYGKASHRQSVLTKVENDLRDIENYDAFNREMEDKEESEEARKKREGKNQMVKNVIRANRSVLARQKKSAALSSLQGGFTTASGTLTLLAGATLGLTGIASLALTTGAIIVGLYNTIKGKKAKAQEMLDVIDCYIGMDGLYNDYIKKNTSRMVDVVRQMWLKDEGGETKIRNKIRDEVVNSLGFKSKAKMYSDIMFLYSERMYNLTFFKNGKMLKRSEVIDADGTVIDSEKNNYRIMLENLGFDLQYGEDNKKPTPSVNEIFKSLTA